MQAATANETQKLTKGERNARITHLMWIVGALVARYGRTRSDLMEDLEAAGSLAIVEAVDTWSPGARSMSSFAYARARLAMLEVLNAERRHSEGVSSLDEDLGADSERRSQTLGEFLSSEAEQEQNLIRAEDSQALSKAMLSLSDRERALVSMRFLEGADYASITAAFNLPAGTAAYQIERALTKLRKQMKK